MIPPRSSDPSDPPRRRRAWLAVVLAPLLGAAAAAAADVPSPAVDVWLDLSEPVPAGARDEAQARRRAERVARQQQAVAAELQRLGAIELARVRHARNSIAVRVDPAQLGALRAIPGVRRVRPVDTLHPPKPGGEGFPRSQPR